jgi:predicted transcriptional regulator YdeE
MDQVKTGGFKLIGKKLPVLTTNEGGQSNIDCGNLWQQFLKENVKNNIPGKISDDIFAVYFDYEGDHTKPFSFFIGCKVGIDTRTPQGMDGLFIPSENYYRFLAKGKIPDCVADAWKEIWTSKIGRAYKYDFEVYGERSQNWNDAEVEIYLSLTI